MSDGMTVAMVVDRQPPAGPCFETWRSTSFGFVAEGNQHIDCAIEASQRLAVPWIEWRWIRGVLEARQDTQYPSYALPASMRNMLKFEHYYIHALTLVMITGFVPKTVPLGPFDLEGHAVKPPRSGELMVLDPFVVKDRQANRVLARTRVQLRANRDFILGLGRQDTNELSMLSARFRQVGHG